MLSVKLINSTSDFISSFSVAVALEFFLRIFVLFFDFFLSSQIQLSQILSAISLFLPLRIYLDNTSLSPEHHRIRKTQHRHHHNRLNTVRYLGALAMVIGAIIDHRLCLLMFRYITMKLLFFVLGQIIKCNC